MSGHLQRLLARVAPGPAGTAGLALGASPVNLPASPLLESDQRIGMPEFSGLAIPVDAIGPGFAAAESPEPQPKVDPARGSPRSRQPRNRKAVRTVEQQNSVEPGFGEGAEPKLANPGNNPVRQPLPAPAGLPIAEPDRSGAQASSPLQLSPFAIAHEDFEPAARNVELGDPQSWDAASQTAALPLSEPQPARAAEPSATEVPSRDCALAEPLPVAAALPTQPLETLPGRADAEPVRNERLDAELIEALTEPGFGGPGAGSVVIEQVVIEVVAPPAAPVSAQAALSDPRSRAMPSGPQTAEAASLIGPLPISRPFASLYGMRRR